MTTDTMAADFDFPTTPVRPTRFTELRDAIDRLTEEVKKLAVPTAKLSPFFILVRTERHGGGAGFGYGAVATSIVEHDGPQEVAEALASQMSIDDSYGRVNARCFKRGA